MGDYLNSQPPPGAFAQAYGQPQQQQQGHPYQNQQPQQPYQTTMQHQNSAAMAPSSAYSSAPPPPPAPHQHHQQQQTMQHRPIALHAAPPGVPAPQQRRPSRNGSGSGGKSMASSTAKKAMPALRALDFVGHLDEDFVVRSASGGF